MENELLEYIQTKINEAKKEPYKDIKLNNKWSPKQIEDTLEALGWKYSRSTRICDCIYQDENRKYIYQDENSKYNNYRHYQKYILVFTWNGWCQEKSFSMVDR